MPLLVAVLIVAAAAALLRIVWRRRWGYPPDSFPRVLAYHKITSFELGGTWVSPASFAAQLDALRAEGYRFIDEEAFLSTLEGARPACAREILLTIDDGYAELIDHAAPALEARGIPALLFLVADFAGRRNDWDLKLPGKRFRHLDWEEARSLLRRGFAFGSHTCTHRDLRRLGLEDLRRELVDSRRTIEDRLGSPVRSLSYPFGLTNPLVVSEARRAGYRAAFSMYPSIPNARIDSHNLRRDGVYIVDTILALKTKLGRGRLFWIEDVKGRAINAVAVLTPILTGGAAASRRERP